jgi:hypothetical protein
MGKVRKQEARLKNFDKQSKNRGAQPGSVHELESADIPRLANPSLLSSLRRSAPAMLAVDGWPVTDNIIISTHEPYGCSSLVTTITADS